VDKIGEVIGPKGKVINQIQDDTGATLSIEDDGTVYIGATNGEAAEAARAAVNAIANPTMPEVGERYLGTVVKTTNFGAFVSLLPGKDGLLHISKLRSLAGGKRVENVEDVVSVGQKLQVEISGPDEMSSLAPRIITIKVPVDKIGEVIGPKGKIINQIQDDTGAQLTIEDDGTIYIGATNGEAAEAARAAVNAIANPTMPEVGERYLGTVVKTTNFGAFVSLLPGKDGLLHISKLRALAGGKRVDSVEDVVSVGQKVQVQIAEIDDRGKLSLVPVVDEADGGAAETAEAAPEAADAE
jgi:polyribonucleotide nucleotidyltransferase